MHFLLKLKGVPESLFRNLFSLVYQERVVWQIWNNQSFFFFLHDV